MLSETLKTYLEVLEIYSDDIVRDACARLTREAREFPPTAGEVRAMAEKIVVATMPRPLALTDETRPLANDLTPEQRAANVRRLKELLAEIGAKARMDAPAPKTARPAPFNFGPSLMRNLTEKGLVKSEPPAALGADDDAPAF